MHHRISFFLALRLTVRRFQPPPAEGLSFVKILATFGIINATDYSLLQNSYYDSIFSVDSSSIFQAKNPRNHDDFRAPNFQN